MQQQAVCVWTHGSSQYDRKRGFGMAGRMHSRSYAWQRCTHACMAECMHSFGRRMHGWLAHVWEHAAMAREMLMSWTSHSSMCCLIVQIRFAKAVIELHSTVFYSYEHHWTKLVNLSWRTCTAQEVRKAEITERRTFSIGSRFERTKGRRHFRERSMPA